MVNFAHTNPDDDDGDEDPDPHFDPSSLVDSPLVGPPVEILDWQRLVLGLNGTGRTTVPTK